VWTGGWGRSSGKEGAEWYERKRAGSATLKRAGSEKEMKNANFLQLFVHELE